MSKRRSEELAHLYLTVEPIPLPLELGLGNPPYDSKAMAEERYGWMTHYVTLSPRLLQEEPPSAENSTLLTGLLELMKSGEIYGVRIDPLDVRGIDVLEEVMGLMTQIQIPYIIQDIYDDPNVPAEDLTKEKDYLVSRILAIIFNGDESVENKHKVIVEIAQRAIHELKFDFSSWIPF